MPKICFNEEMVIDINQRMIEFTCPSYVQQPNPYLSKKEVMEFLSISSETTLQNYRDSGKIEYVMLSSRHFIYSRSSIMDFLNEKTIKRF